jgi:DNA primase
MKSNAVAQRLKQQIPLLDFLIEQGWKPARRVSRDRWMGVCPLHRDQQPSFLVDPQTSLFYCYGCQQGGDLIRFVEKQRGVGFSEAMAILRRWRGVDCLLDDVIRFYQLQLRLHPEAIAYLQRRGIQQPEVIDRMRIGYAPGSCLRAHLLGQGYSFAELLAAGVVTTRGLDSLYQRIVFPLETTLYGRSLGNAHSHQFLPGGGKGGLYNWREARISQEVILVEGLFDWAALWQAGFHNVVCSMGTCLNATQTQQLLDGNLRRVYIAFDSDGNGSGQQAARQLSHRLAMRGVETFVVDLPQGHDPNSFFSHGEGDAQHFQTLLSTSKETARARA